VVRSEKLIELGDSWFSTKSILVEQYTKKQHLKVLLSFKLITGVERLFSENGKLIKFLLPLTESPNTVYVLVRPWVQRSKVERETAQITV